MIRYSANINVMMSAARKASKSILRDFGELEKLQVSIKGQNDFVTMADIKAQEIIHYELARAREDHGFLMEEGKNKNNIDENEFTWIIDPIDGTLNFMNGIPYFAISIALHQKDKLIAGIVYDPVHNDFYWAEEGVGAYLNDQRLRVKSKSSLDKSIIAMGIPFLGRGNHKQHIKSQEIVMSRVAGLRRFGAASLDLAYVAAGKVDGFWEYGLSPWDVAAGIILVREAGGIASGIDDKENPLLTGNIVAGNINIVKELKLILNS
ncbi:MAG: Inositol-1-monophosphatase [Alphaproteobacteria bacterium MarineAlpha9_Bin3]|mgnify:FL=1|nr:MAG: Inositol-1-monophosphatase [Alphaproteobacteria bacterium MarineAlpha9_Bin3]|tara:strand:- start:890 stop:1681 length:792 start_codon:yes stop_codon:yes gene_type:complete